MKRTYLVPGVFAAAALAGCGGGDINIQPSTNVSNSNNTTTTGGGGASDVCASYTNTGGQTIRGVYGGTNCTYSPAFVDAGNNLTVDLTIPALPNNGAHIFEGSLFVGEAFDTDADLAAAGLARGGDGPVLTIEPRDAGLAVEPELHDHQPRLAALRRWPSRCAHHLHVDDRSRPHGPGARPG